MFCRARQGNSCPALFIEYDLRILFFHLLLLEKQEEFKENITTTLELTSFDLKEIYLRLNERLKYLFKELTTVLENI